MRAFQNSVKLDGCWTKQAKSVRGLIGSEGEQMIRVRSSLPDERRSGCFRTVHAEMSRLDLDLFNLQVVVYDLTEQMHEGLGRESGL